MEEDVQYSTVVFKSAASPAPREKAEEETIYSDVKCTSPPATTVTDGRAAGQAGVLLVCLGILCVLLVACVSVIIYIFVETNTQRAKLDDMTEENHKLRTRMSDSQKQTAELRRVTDGLNWTLGVIMTFDNFPVRTFCPGKRISSCRPCQTGWTHFQKKCYFIYDQPPQWKTWQQSRTICKGKGADLTVIETPQEQEFLSNNTKYYFSTNHGYWFGLNKPNNGDWRWIDGRNLTLEYWKPHRHPGSCGLLIPSNSSLASWHNSSCTMLNKFICETGALIWSN